MMPGLGAAGNALSKKANAKSNSLNLDSVNRKIEEVRQQVIFTEENFKKNMVSQKTMIEKETEKKIKASLVPI